MKLIATVCNRDTVLHQTVFTLRLTFIQKSTVESTKADTTLKSDLFLACLQSAPDATCRAKCHHARPRSLPHQLGASMKVKVQLPSGLGTHTLACLDELCTCVDLRRGLLASLGEPLEPGNFATVSGAVLDDENPLAWQGVEDQDLLVFNLLNASGGIAQGAMVSITMLRFFLRTFPKK